MASAADELAPFELAFRDLYLRDIVQADAGDVRMGTFILCGAFIDALALTYSAGKNVPRRKAGKWAIFMEQYFGESYRALWDSYGDFRNKLLHNYSPHGIAFTHGPTSEALHLTLQSGRVLLHRESFVRDVSAAFEKFAADLHADAELRSRALKHLTLYQPIGLVPLTAPSPLQFPSPRLFPSNLSLSASAASAAKVDRKS
jgi:hypothetical protein